MKNKNYLCRYYDGSYFLSRGLPMEDDKTLALVHAWSRNDLEFPWMVIDINSGTFVARGTTKKKCLINYNHRCEDPEYDIKFEILETRKTQRYKTLCEELEVEEHIWRESGYDI